MEVLLFGFNKKVVYASETEKEGTNLTQQIHEAFLAAALDTMLSNGKAPETGYEEIIGGKRYFWVLDVFCGFDIWLYQIHRKAIEVI